MVNPAAETRATYDLIAAEYAGRNATVDPQALDDAAVLTSRLSPGCVVADVGCGPGRELALLRAHGFRVIGLDLSFGQLLAGDMACVAQADMRRLPLRTASVDAVWCRAALLHVPREHVVAVLVEFARAIRVGGELCLAVAEGDGEVGDRLELRIGSQTLVHLPPGTSAEGTAHRGRVRRSSSEAKPCLEVLAFPACPPGVGVRLLSRGRAPGRRGRRGYGRPAAGAAGCPHRRSPRRVPERPRCVPSAGL